MPRTASCEPAARLAGPGGLRCPTPPARAQRSRAPWPAPRPECAAPSRSQSRPSPVASVQDQCDPGLPPVHELRDGGCSNRQEREGCKTVLDRARAPAHLLEPGLVHRPGQRGHEQARARHGQQAAHRHQRPRRLGLGPAAHRHQRPHLVAAPWPAPWGYIRFLLYASAFCSSSLNRSEPYVFIWYVHVPTRPSPPPPQHTHTSTPARPHARRARTFILGALDV